MKFIASAESSCLRGAKITPLILFAAGETSALHTGALNTRAPRRQGHRL
jgi:hypothetical protein